MKIPANFFQRITVLLFIGAVVIFLFQYFQGYEDSIGWNVTTTADSQEFAAYPFEKGPFQFSFAGEKYSLAETFSAGPIKRDLSAEAGFVGLILLGLCLIIAVSTYLSRLWFIGIMALFIFFVMGLHLPEVQVFGFDNRSSVGIIIVMCAYLIPAYLFHAFFTDVRVEFRLITFLVATAAIVWLSGVPLHVLHDQFTVGSYFGLVVIALIFLMLIAEENIFAILYLVTRTKGGKSNHIHFMIFSLVYLGILGLYYGKKSGAITTETAFFDPFVLLALSSMIALWSFRFKEQLFDAIMEKREALLMLIGLGLVTFGHIALGMFRGNDPVYEGLHYLIVYTHLGFGAFFFIYIIVNFITPLIRGMEVYKVAYKPQTFHYVSAKLAGLVAIAAFFYLASKEPFLLFRAGSYNYLGAQAEQNGQPLLAGEYYREGTVFGHDNHYSNYKIGYRNLQKQKLKEANYRFGRATLRYPSPHAFVNQAGTFAMMNEATPSLVGLKEGLRIFPNNAQLQNNLGLTYADMGKRNDAVEILAKSDPTGDWTNANLVNLWKVMEVNEKQASSDYRDGNLAVKTNVISALLQSSLHPDLTLDTTELYPAYPLHRLAFLINASWYFQSHQVADQLKKVLESPVKDELYLSAQNARALAYFSSGNINESLYTLDLMVNEASGTTKAKYLNEMGLIALSQHAIDEALRFFELAIAEGNESSFLNKQACLLEAGRIDDAIAWSAYLVSIDSSYQQLAADLKRIQSRENLTTDQQLYRLYYFYQEYSSAEISALLSDADRDFINSLWIKVSYEMLVQNNFENANKYRAVFNPYLSPEAFEETDLLVALGTGQQIKGNHSVAKALMLSDSAQMATALQSISNQNALNEPLVLAIAKILEAIDQAAAYEVLVKAVDINKSNVALRKQYVLTATQSGLNQYASDVLAELETSLSASEYDNFYQEYLAAKEALENSDW